jgi:enediyne biosynthesis protein E4
VKVISVKWYLKQTNLGSTISYPRSQRSRRRVVAPWAIYLCAALTLSCGIHTTAEDIQGTPLNSSKRTSDQATLFEKLPPSKTGIHFNVPLSMEHPKSYLNLSGFVCGGVAIGDLNGDDLPDIFLVNGPGENHLYIQESPFHFTETLAGRSLGGGDAWGVGSVMVDIDNDEDLDIYVCNYDAPNQLFINHQSGDYFEESAAAFGIDVVDASLMPAFADYDNDGDLDLFLVTNRYYRPQGRPSRPPVGFKDGRPYILPDFEKYYYLRQTGASAYTTDSSGRPDRLFQNNGKGRFTDVSRTAGIQKAGHGLSATWWDYNTDGHIDLYVGNDFTDPDRLYHNNGDGTFTDVIADTMPYTTWSSMGADCADINNDGMLDFLSVDMASTTHYKSKVTMGDMGDRRWFLEHAWPRQIMRNNLFLNTGTGYFMEVAHLANLAGTDWSWAIKLADFDNDTRIDAFVSNGAARMSTDADRPVSPEMLIGRTEWDIWKNTPTMPEQNLAFRNLGDLRFEDISQLWGLDDIGMSYGAAYGDLDRDGDLDLVVTNLETPVSIYRNNSQDGNRVLFKLKGKVNNSQGIGAVLTLQTQSESTQVRQHNPMTGFLSSNDPVIHFGLGDATKIQQVTVTWPNGHQQRHEGLQANHSYTIVESNPASIPALPAETNKETQFSEVSQSIGLNFNHQETPFDDYQRQALLPGKHSQLGGGLAWGDADGDGDEDLYLAGAAGQPGALYFQNGDGSFSRNTLNQVVFNAHRQHEDMAPLWLDADIDGDQDLFVSSGGVECQAGSRLLVDRLYLNDGKGRLTMASADRLPEHPSSSSSAVAGDFDADGDLDIFIGSRVIPGQYPKTPTSRLLRNDDGFFKDVTDEVAPGLRKPGMVTSALWTDVNNDDKLDLLLALEWGPIKCFIQQNKRLIDTTSVTQTANLKGWWNAITGTDIDGDGDMDYAVMNVGLNTKYGTPDAKHPASLFYGDMDGTGQSKIIEAKTGKEGLIPIRGFSCSSGAIPSLRKKFPTFRSFASSVLPGIYTEHCLDEAITLKANHFESGVMINNGSGVFSWQPFPRLAQASPAFGVVSTDFDADGLIDLHTVQNLYSREPETGLWRGGIGFSGSFSPNGLFEMHDFSKSGFWVPSDGKGLSICDFNADGWPDVVATQNNDRLLAFRNNGSKGVFPLRIRLRGPKGNPTGVGARLTLRTMKGQTQTREVYAGSGYLSQSTSTLFFGNSATTAQLDVRWPDGSRSHQSLDGTSREIHYIGYPDS